MVDTQTSFVDMPPARRAQERESRDTIVKVRGLVVGFGEKLVMKGLDLDIRRGEVLGFVGGSGTGKSVLGRTILGLLHKRAGTIEVFGQDIDNLSQAQHRALERRWGVMFQQGALFSSLTVKQNVQVPMREYLDISPKLRDELALLKLELVGLARDAADKYPIRTFRRHDQARCSRPRPRARSRIDFSGRADVRPGPDRRRRI